MKVALIAKPVRTYTGVGRYVAELANGLHALGHQVIIVHPVNPLPAWLTRLVYSLLKWDLDAFFSNYPVWANYPQADIFHITSQNLATLMFFRRPPGKTVITIHDIFPHLLKKSRLLAGHNHIVDRFFDALAMRGIKRVPFLLAVSEYTKNCLTEHFGFRPDHIFVTLEGVRTTSLGTT